MSIKKYFAGQTIPENERFAYIIGKDGFYILKRNDVFEACVLIESIPEIPQQKETFQLKAKKIPYELIKQVLSFLLAIYQKYRAESMVLLCYKEDKWSVCVPEQEVSGGSVKYKNNDHNVVGSIHSHPGFSSSASGTDEKDELDFDGIHIIISSFLDICPEISCCGVINGQRFEINPEDIIDDLPQPDQMIPKDWLNQVNHKEEFLFEKSNKRFLKKETIKIGKEPVKLLEIEDEWPCERCLHEDVCSQDVMEANGTCPFFEFDQRKEESEVIV